MSGSDVEYGTWEQNRHSNLEILQQSDLFTDVRLRVEDETFHAHRYIPTNQSSLIDQSQLMNKTNHI